MNEPCDVLCAGIVVADHVCTPITHLPAAGELVIADRLLLTIGGCAANVAVDLVKMGVRARVVGRVGDDVFGRAVGEMLREQGVDAAGLMTSAGVDTSQTLIVNVAGQDRRFIHTFGANALFSPGDIPLEVATHCKVLYLGGYLLMPEVKAETLAPLFAVARQAGAKTVLDVVTPGKADYLPWLERLLPEVDVFLPNNHEAELITGKADPVAQAETFHRMGAATSIITLGGEGAVVVGKGLRVKVEAFSVPFVDGSGGGDAFAAGYIVGLLEGLDPMGCLETASALGASCVQAIGTTTSVFTRSQCEAFLKTNRLRVMAL